MLAGQGRPCNPALGELYFVQSGEAVVLVDPALPSPPPQLSLLDPKRAGGGLLQDASSVAGVAASGPNSWPAAALQVGLRGDARGVGLFHVCFHPRAACRCSQLPSCLALRCGGMGEGRMHGACGCLPPHTMPLSQPDNYPGHQHVYCLTTLCGNLMNPDETYLPGSVHARCHAWGLGRLQGRPAC